MADQKRRGRPPKHTVHTLIQEEEEEEEEEANGYEQARQERMRANAEKLEKMGILDLSKKLKSHFLPPQSAKKPRLSSTTKPDVGPPRSPRRSSRLTTISRVNYTEKGRSPEKDVKPVRSLEIHIEDGSEPEIYREEHEQLLGDCKSTWTLYVDGYGEDGQRIYDPHEGKSCHQCRQKTLGLHTKCSACKTVQGQFCGDCLFMRYGENVIEVNENPCWTCPVCRGICNCSRCRRDKGWAPTGSIYRKVKGLGFKSVAHYLIQTRGPKQIQEGATNEDSNTGEESLPFVNVDSKLISETSKPESDSHRSEAMKEEVENSMNKDCNHETHTVNTIDDDDEDYEPSGED